MVTVSPISLQMCCGIVQLQKKQTDAHIQHIQENHHLHRLLTGRQTYRHRRGKRDNSHSRA